MAHMSRHSIAMQREEETHNVDVTFVDRHVQGLPPSAISGLCIGACLEEGLHHADVAPDARIIAIAPHVHVSKIETARAAGCDAVLTNGQFHGQMTEVLAG